MEENYKKYKAQDGTTVETAIIRVSDGACIPFVEGNRDYLAYLKWLESGNVPLEPDEGN